MPYDIAGYAVREIYVYNNYGESRYFTGYVWLRSVKGTTWIEEGQKNRRVNEEDEALSVVWGGLSRMAISLSWFYFFTSFNGSSIFFIGQVTSALLD